MKINDNTFQVKLSVWEQKVSAFHIQISPILNVSMVGKSTDNLGQSIQKEIAALGIHEGVRAWAEDLILHFPYLTTQQKESVYSLKYNNSSIDWACPILEQSESIEAFRKKLIWFVIDDQGKDTRDAILRLKSYFEEGKMKDYPVQAIFSETADLASEKDKYGMGSTRNLFKPYI